MNSWIPPGVTLSIVLLSLAIIPLIAYIDYYLLFPHARCDSCGARPKNKHAWLLATTLEVMFLISGIIIGVLTRLS